MQGTARAELPRLRFSFHLLLLLHCLENTCSGRQVSVAGVSVLSADSSPSLLVQADDGGPVHAGV